MASIVLGCTLYGIVHSQGEAERREFLVSQLSEHGYERFANSCGQKSKG